MSNSKIFEHGRCFAKERMWGVEIKDLPASAGHIARQAFWIRDQDLPEFVAGIRAMLKERDRDRQEAELVAERRAAIVARLLETPHAPEP